MILVTGARGLLGTEVVRQALELGRAVRGSDRLPPEPAFLGKCEQVQADLLDPRSCDEICAGVEAVVHTAARQNHSNPPKFGREHFFAQNVVMSRNLADAAERAGVKQLVCVSSDMVYGIPRHGPFRESDRPHPIGPYGRSKLASEDVCVAKRDAGMIVTIFRPRLIIGPGRLGVLCRLFDRIRTGGAVPLIGSGCGRYQMVSVADVATAVMLAVEKRVDGVFNLGSCNVPTQRALLGELARRAGSASRVVPTPRALAEAALWVLHAFRAAPLVPEQFRIAGLDYVLDTSAVRRALGWTPRFDDTEMLWQAYRRYTSGAAATS